MEVLLHQFKLLKFKELSKNLVNNSKTPNLAQLSKLSLNQQILLIQPCSPDLEENSLKLEMNQLKVLLIPHNKKLINLLLTMNLWLLAKTLLTKLIKELLKILQPFNNAFKTSLMLKLSEPKEKLTQKLLKPILYSNQLDGMLYKPLSTNSLLKWLMKKKLLVKFQIS